MDTFLQFYLKQRTDGSVPAVPLYKVVYRDTSFRSTQGFSHILRIASRDTHGQWQVPIFETSVCARACNDHRLIPRQEEEQVFHFSLAYRPTLTSSSSILRMSGVGWKKRRGEERRERSKTQLEEWTEKKRRQNRKLSLYLYLTWDRQFRQ